MKKAIRKLTLHNFQSHSHTVLDLSPQINIIVGPSDVGKTAIIRALRWLFYNQPRGSSFLRVGTSECWVEVETEDGVRVRRYRHEGQKRNGYIIEKPGKDPIVLDRIGNSVPTEVKEALGVRELLLDQDIPIELNIAQQLDGPFLLNHSPSVRAKAIGRLGDAHVIDAAQREIQKDLRSLGISIDRLEADIEAKEHQLGQYAYLDDWKTALDRLEATLARHEQLKKQLEIMRKIADEYRLKKARLDEIEQILENLGNLSKAEEKILGMRERATMLAEIDYLRSQWFKKQDALAQSEETLALTNQLDGVEERLAEINLLSQKVQELLSIKTRHQAISQAIKQNDLLIDRSQGLPQAEKLLDRLIELRAEGVEKSRQLKELKTLSHNKIERQNELNKVEMRLGALTGCLRAETLLDEARSCLVTVEKLAAVAEERSNKLKAIAACQRELNELFKEYQRLSQEYLESLQEMGCCPVCQGTIDEGHLAKIADQLKGDWEFEQ